jgi:hypothetical protein
MYDQDWINDGYGSRKGSGGITHKVDKIPGNPICGATFQNAESTSRLRVKWSKVTCQSCLRHAPKQVLDQRNII